MLSDVSLLQVGVFYGTDDWDPEQEPSKASTYSKQHWQDSKEGVGTDKGLHISAGHFTGSHPLLTSILSMQ